MAVMPGARRSAVAASKTSTRRWSSRPWSRSTAPWRRPASRSPAAISTRTVFRSAQRGKSSWKIALPQSRGTIRLAARSNGAARAACARASRAMAASGFVVVLANAGAADHDLVLFDRDLDRPVTGPVLGVDGVVLHGGVEPEPVPLLAVVEGALERLPGAAAAAAAAASPAARLGLGIGVEAVLARLLGVAGGLVLLGALGGLVGGAGVLLGLAGGLGLQLRGDRGVVLGAEIDLVAVGGGLVAVSFQPLLSLERLDLLYRRFQLVRYPRIGAALADPRADLI